MPKNRSVVRCPRCAEERLLKFVSPFLRQHALIGKWGKNVHADFRRELKLCLEC